MIRNKTIAVIGLGYVGLPLAIEFCKHHKTIGFDIDASRILELKNNSDRTKECSSEELLSSKNLSFTTNIYDIKEAEIYIVTVPTPVDNANRPDMSPLINASRDIGKILKNNDIVIYESTVYPGATEEICVPVLEKNSGLKFNFDFYCGYSPERINPGDKKNRLPNIKKITSGSTPEIASEIDQLYKKIIVAGTHKASSIKVAEAAKVIENTQRDINIALMNELSLIFNKLNIDTNEVLEAAGTKWNFLPFKPGLVGGHCISVDPYYLIHRAIQVGYHPEVIAAGRRVNDTIAEHIADHTLKIMLKMMINPLNSKVLILGLTFKENCPDIRNTKVINVYKRLVDQNINVDIVDPWVDAQAAHHEYQVKCLKNIPKETQYDAVILAVNHDIFLENQEHYILKNRKINSVLFDVKAALPKNCSDARL